MQINITNKESLFSKTLKKLTLVFLGVFITSFIFMFATRIPGSLGIWLGLLICAGLIFCGFYYVKPHTRLRTITLSMLWTIIICTIVFAFGIFFLSSSLQGL
jgi:hypothetical protein